MIPKPAFPAFFLAQTPMLFSSPAVQAKFLHLRVALAGLAVDFWKDTPLSPSSGRAAAKAAKEAAKAAAKAAKEAAKAAQKPAGPEEKTWSGDRIQIMEKLWGDGHHLPGGDAYIDTLAKPLSLTKEMSVLDLGAGLAGMGRRLAEEFGTYVTGLETDQTLVSRGMILSIAAGKGKQASIEAFQPENFKASRKYDCIFARELFYRVANKDPFFQAVADSVKPGGGQLVFTDFTLEPTARAYPAVAAWLKTEHGVSPQPSTEIIKTWKALGFDMRIAEDQTELYTHQVFVGLADLLSFLNGKELDKGTKLLLLKELDFWTKRLAAFREGLKYYRFYAVKYKNANIT